MWTSVLTAVLQRAPSAGSKARTRDASWSLAHTRDAVPALAALTGRAPGTTVGV